MSSVETVIVGVGGIVVGALLTALLELLLDRRREARRAQAAELEIDGMLQVAERRLEAHLADNVHWWWDDASAPSLKAWEAGNEALAPVVRAQLQTTINELVLLNEISSSRVAEADKAEQDRASGSKVPLPSLEFTQQEEQTVRDGLNDAVNARTFLDGRKRAQRKRSRWIRGLTAVFATAVVAAAVVLPLTLPTDNLTPVSLGNALQTQLRASSVACTPVGTSNDAWDCLAGFGLVPAARCQTTLRSLVSVGDRVTTAAPEPSSRAACDQGLEEWRALRESKKRCAQSNMTAATFGRLDAAEKQAVIKADKSGRALANLKQGLEPVSDLHPGQMLELCP